jgi:1-acyl-sn-glycerol-3-phosphate acyltransferase
MAAKSTNFYYFWRPLEMEIKLRKRLIIRAFLQVLSVIWKIYSVVVLFITLLLFYPIYILLLTSDKLLNTGFKLIRLHSKIILVLIGVRARIKWEGKLPEPPFIICPNHTSYLDIILLYRVFPEYFIFIGKRELETDRLFSIFFKKMNILVKRDSAVDGMRALNKAADEMKKGTSVVIFPEGTIPNNAPDLMPFKSGPFLLAIREEIPIVPITFINVFKLLQIGAFLRRRGKPGLARIVVNEVVETKGLTKKDLIPLRDKVYGVIDNTIKEHYLHRN